MKKSEKGLIFSFHFVRHQMNSIRVDIVKWLNQQPYWIQLAAQYILKQEEITPEKAQVIKELLKTEIGQSCAQSLDFDAFTDHLYSVNSVWISSISEIVGIDDLNPRTPLPFDKKLTVVYGNNGSGKSGYTRILKKACGKNNAIELKPNIFKPPSSDNKCAITIEGENTQKIDWKANSKPISEINATDIFDSSTVGLYLDRENEMSYIPLEVLLFEKLVVLLISLKSTLDMEQRQLIKRLPNTPNEFAQSKYIRAINDRLKADVPEQTLRDFFDYTSDDAYKFNELNERLKGDPSKLRDKKTSAFKQLNELVLSITEASAKVNFQACKVLNEAHVKLESAKIVAEKGAKAISGNDCLEGIGSQTWKAMWAAAKAYSKKEAYPKHASPNIDNEAKCVLCQQSLSDKAKHRFHSFEEHVQGTLEKEVNIAQQAFDNLIKKLPTIQSEDTLKAKIAASNLVEEEWLPVLSEIWSDIKKTSDALTSNPEILTEGFTLTSLQLVALTDKSTLLNLEIENHQKDVIAFDKERLTTEFNDYKAKKWASENIDAIIQEVKRLEEYRKYEQWTALLTTTKFTRKAGEVSQKVITDAYVQRFNTELDKLGAKKIKIQLSKTRASRGKVMHKLHLMGANEYFNKSKSCDILSEGEQRIVSLAAFLADSNGKPQTAPFIFDDPISSLDQSYEQCVAKRLVELSAHRQVIVFTHRISLLGAFNDLGNPRCVHIRREPWGCGEHGSIPLFAKKPLNALKELKNERLAKARKSLDSDGYENYAPLAKAICSDFRILLERVVELEFLADIVQRHRKDVQTKNKIGNLAKINAKDCNLIECLMDKYSVHEHSQSIERPTEPPTPEDLDADISSVIDWHAEFKTRKC